MRPRHGEWGFALAMAITLVAAAPAAATSWIVPDPESMADSADAVVLATVEQIRSIAEYDGSSITTEVTLHVQEGYKGAVAGERLVLHEVGGRVGLDTQWAFGSPEYHVGETVVAYVERSGGGRLRTQHMAIGKLDTEILEDGRVALTRIRRGGARTRETLSSFERGLATDRRRARGAVRLAGRLQPNAPQLEGISQPQANFRLMEPGSRWFDLPVAIWGDLAGDKALGKQAGSRIVQEGAEAWNNQAGSEFEIQYKGNQKGPGFVCNPGYMTVSFDDPKDQVGDPTSCGGGALAVGGFCATANPKSGSPYREITSGAVVFNNGWNDCWFWNETNLKEIVTHEVGHAIGFAHSWDGHLGTTNDPFIVDSTMFWMAHFDGRGGGLRDYDKGVVALLYDDGGAPAPTPTPKPTPVPTPKPDIGNGSDLDGDGVNNAQDNCPDLANSLQGDADADGLGDMCDACDASADPGEVCSSLVGSARIVVNAKGRVNALVRVTFPPWIQKLGKNVDLDVDLVSDSGSYGISLAGSDFRVNRGKTTAKLQRNNLSATVRKYGDGMTRVTLRVKDNALAGLVGEDLTVRVAVPGQSAFGQMSCSRRHPDKRYVTHCKVR